MKKEEQKMDDFTREFIVNYLKSPILKTKMVKDLIICYEQAIFESEKMHMIYKEKFKREVKEELDEGPELSDKLFAEVEESMQYQRKSDVLRNNLLRVYKIAALYEEIDKAILMLDPRVFDFVRMIYQEGMSQKEVVAESGYSSKAIANKVEKGVMKLLEYIDKEKLEEAEKFMLDSKIGA